MGFTFLHAADLHLGSPLKGLARKDGAIAARFAEAGRDALTALVDRALAEKVAFAVIAGDVYDGAWKDTSVGLFFNREIARLARAGIPVYMIRGNHDAESVVTTAVPLPEGAILFPSRPRTERIEALKVALHGRSFAAAAVPDNVVPDYPAAVPGWFNIGLLHTSLEGNAAHAVYAPCSLADLAARGYDYWALGHVHDHAILATDPHVVYPGNLQGRSIREQGAKGAVLVDVEDGRVTAVRPVHVDRARWLGVAVDLAAVADESGLRAGLAAALAPGLAARDGRLVAVRVMLSGATPLHRRLAADRTAARDTVQAVLDHLGDDIWLEKLVLATADPAAAPEVKGAGPPADDLLAGLAADPALRAEAADLMNQVANRFPHGIDGSDEADETPQARLDALMAEAEALVRARLEAG